MPPRGRSNSSSRSSSSRSRSSSRSSSSRSSSSRSRSSSSRPSSRSSSTRSYSSKSYNYGGSSNNFNNNRNNYTKKQNSEVRKSRIFANNYKRPIRETSSFILNNKKPSTTLHHCFKHDYYYFNEDFIDEFSGQTFKKGYYDEAGTFYEDLTLDFSKMETISMYTCEHCESSIKLDLVSSPSNEALTCPSCGAIVDLNKIFALNIDYYVCDDKGTLINENLIKNEYTYEYDYQPSSYTYSNNSNSSGIGISVFLKFIITIFIIMNIIPFILFIPMFIGGSLYSSNNDNYYEESNQTAYDDYYDYNIFGESIYVSAIDRYCYFDGDYYYDVTSDCYFCYNTKKDIPSMQFWFEDFSYQYGDYGWLEYDEYEECWYVEVGYNKWEKVENPPDYFWYTTFDQLLIDNEKTNY